MEMMGIIMLEWIAEILENFEPQEIILMGGLIVGVLFGGLAQKSAFCFRRAVLDGVGRKIGSSAIMFIAAIGVAILGSQWLFQAAQIETSGIVALMSNYSIGALVVGGLLFGIGMVLTNGCTARHVILASEGSARSWVVISVIAMSAYATLRGILALPRLELEAAGQSDYLGADEGAITLTDLFNIEFIGGYNIGLIIGAAILGLIFFVALRKGNYSALSYGVAIGGLVPFAWAITGVFGYDEFEPAAAQSLSFVSPIANGLQFLMTYTGSTAGFSTMVLAGAFLGAFILAIVTRKFSFRSFENEKDILRYVVGGILMGFGGVAALGCTIGQGLAGLSLLSISSLIAISSIGLGAVGTAKIIKGKEKQEDASLNTHIEAAVS